MKNNPMKDTVRSEVKGVFLNRAWISPATSISFLVVAITGVMLAFHMKSRGVKLIHEWIGYTFILAGVVHLLLNWKAFKSYFRQRSAIVALIAVLVATVALLSASSGSASQQSKLHPLVRIFDTNSDGVIDNAEMQNASAALAKLDKNADGIITAEEFTPPKKGKSKR